MSPSPSAFPEGSRLYGCQKYVKAAVHWFSHCDCSGKNTHHPVHQILVKLGTPSAGRGFILLGSQPTVSRRLSYGSAWQRGGAAGREEGRAAPSSLPSARPRSRSAPPRLQSPLTASPPTAPPTATHRENKIHTAIKHTRKHLESCPHNDLLPITHTNVSFRSNSAARAPVRITNRRDAHENTVCNQVTNEHWDSLE